MKVYTPSHACYGWLFILTSYHTLLAKDSKASQRFKWEFIFGGVIFRFKNDANFVRNWKVYEILLYIHQIKISNSIRCKRYTCVIALHWTACPFCPCRTQEWAVSQAWPRPTSHLTAMAQPQRALLKLGHIKVQNPLSIGPPTYTMPAYSALSIMLSFVIYF